MTEAFKELAATKKDIGNIRLKCPECGHVQTRRRDALAIGLHWIKCRNFGSCEYASYEIELRSGKKATRSSKDF